MYAPPIPPSVPANPAGRAATGVYASASLGVVPQVRLLTYLMVGTLGLATPDYMEKRSATSTWAQAEPQAAPAPLHAARARLAPAAQLDRIRSVLKANIADTASVFGVSRQALYNWRAGEAISVANLAKLDDLAAAADILAAAGLDQVPQLARRKLGGGKTLLETARDGGSAREAAISLVRMLEREAIQRERVERSLAGRRAARIDVADAGLPGLDESN